MRDCNFVGNTNTFSNGTIQNLGILVVDHSHFIDNTGEEGAAIYSTGTLTVNNSLFLGNNANDSSSIIVAGSGVITTLTNDIFIDNTTVDGEMIWDCGTLVTSNVIFINNIGGDIN